jgi:hypothetical protein
MGVADNWFEKLAGKVNSSIKVFSAAIFFLFSLGMVYGIYFFTMDARPFFLIIPPILGLMAYYSRNFALIALGASLVIFLF